MNFSYFRKSTFSLEETLDNVKKLAEKRSWNVLGEADFDSGKMVLICKKEWVKTLVKENYELLGFLPCAVSVFEKDGNLMVGTGQPSVIKALAKNPATAFMAQEAEKQVKELINEAAGVGELKPTNVKLYSTMSCPYCKMEKSWLEEKKVDHKVVYVDLNPDEAQKMVEKTGQMGVPVTEIEFEEGEPQYIIGFDKPTLSQLLGVN